MNQKNLKRLSWFLEGFGSVLDVWPKENLATLKGLPCKRRDPKTDLKSIASDFEAVAHDLQKAIEAEQP